MDKSREMVVQMARLGVPDSIVMEMPDKFTLSQKELQSISFENLAFSHFIGS